MSAEPAVAAARPSEESAWKASLRAPEWSLLAGIFVVLGVIYFLDPSHAFFSRYSLTSALHNTVLYGVLSVGVAVVIIAGGIDLSIGAVVALSSVVCAKLIVDWLPGLHDYAGPFVLFESIPVPVVRILAIGLPAALALGLGAAAGQRRIGWIAAGIVGLIMAVASFWPGTQAMPGRMSLSISGPVVRILAIGLPAALALGLGAAAGQRRIGWIAAGVVGLIMAIAAYWPGTLAMPVRIVFGIVLSLILGLQVGLLHAILITTFRLPPFIATLATMAGLRSLAMILSGNRSINVEDPAFRVWGSDNSYTVPIFVLVAAAMSLMMGVTVLGRHLYALGGNEAAARLNGLPIRRLKSVAYGLAGLLSALGGILFTGNSGQATGTMGMSYELYAITAAVVGGCSLQGGVGSIRGTVLGLVLIQIVIKGTGLIVHGIDSTQIEGLVLGTVVVLAVAFNQRFRRGS